jgi:hypothetical protein
MQRKLELKICGSRAPEAAFPKRVDRKAGAEIISQLHFPISPRTLERWPLTWQRINGRSLCETTELLAEAQRRVSEAPRIAGGE